MGRATERIRLTSYDDPEKSVEVEALIDTGAMMLVLPQDVVDELGLRKFEEVTVRYANNSTEVRFKYGVVTVEIKGRAGRFDVLAEPEGCQPLVGQLVLEGLDLVVDPANRSVLPNPRSPDMPMVDVLGHVLPAPTRACRRARRDLVKCYRGRRRTRTDLVSPRGSAGRNRAGENLTT